ncbi:MAG: PAS domain S-box protein [Thermodesulfobacteriota bacterium]
MLERIRNSLGYHLIFVMGITLFAGFTIWAYFNIRYQKEKMMNYILVWTDRLGETIKLGTEYAMMLNARDNINQSIQNIGRLEAIDSIRIFNKEGEIKFSKNLAEINTRTNIRNEACHVCHKSDPPAVDLPLTQRVRVLQTADGHRGIGIISPIRNAPGCSTGDCHFHSPDKNILGALDVVVSLKETDQDILYFEEGVILLSAFLFLSTAAVIFCFILRFVNRPIMQLIEGTRRIAKGDFSTPIHIPYRNELGQLAEAFAAMGKRIEEKQQELRNQRIQYQTLFERVPCIITVQDREFRLLQYNREFSRRFDPQPGDFCYKAYKDRNEKCPECPVEWTFADGKGHYSEETGYNKDGSRTYWVVQTAPIKDAEGNIVAAMEMSIDISRSKQLEEQLAESERKYHDIFNNIPNPVFVLDIKTLDILDCNTSAETIYGYDREELIGKRFLELFPEGEREDYAFKMLTASVVNKARQIHRKGNALFVNIRISPSEYAGQSVLLVTTTDETKRIEAEQQIIQASKMATLGEMATGVAHELNQPLSVIKTASSFFIRKIEKNEPIPDAILQTLAKEIDSHVDRAARIISHMRQFGRKTEVRLEKVNLNDVVKKSFEMFSQQLRARGIDVEWHLTEMTPWIWADAARLEQVFINLLINARDAIEERMEKTANPSITKRIQLKTQVLSRTVAASVSDTGCGIPPDILDKIFEPFFTTKQVGKGTGLGLSISYGIVRECNGEISAVNNDDGGATFIVQFPKIDENDNDEK